MTKVQERQSASVILDAHPAVVFLGPPLTGVIRAIEVVLGREGVDSTEVYAAYQGDYPDLQVYDGREIGPDEARQIRENSTLCPSSWSRRYVVISHVDRPHYSFTPILLKLIEEPPAYFSILMTTLNRDGIPPTILSRSLIMKISPSVGTEVSWWVRENGLDEPEIRSGACAGDLDIAVRMEVDVVNDWRRLWEAVTRGSPLPNSFPARWTEVMATAGEATLVGCWAALVELTAAFAVKGGLWLDLAWLALETRNLIQDGYSNKIQINTSLIKAYALAVTIHSRGK